MTNAKVIHVWLKQFYEFVFSAWKICICDWCCTP